jgi:hypothetical protein
MWPKMFDAVCSAIRASRVNAQYAHQAVKNSSDNSGRIDVQFNVGDEVMLSTKKTTGAKPATALSGRIH